MVAEIDGVMGYYRVVKHVTDGGAERFMFLYRFEGQIIADMIMVCSHHEMENVCALLEDMGLVNAVEIGA